MKHLLGSVLLLASACGPTARDGDLYEARAQAERRGDFAAANRLGLDANEADELRDADQDEARARIDRKYAVLRRALADDPDAEARIIPIVYHEKELAAVKEILRLTGDLYAAPAPAEEAILAAMPWSGYWYPLSGTDLYQGDDAPLVKLDKLAAKLGRPGGTAKWEADHHDTIPAASWEGFCGAWATAAALMPEPVKSLEYKGIVFKPSDLKGLLTKAHETYPTKILGVRYNGDADTDGTFQDIRPEGFHRLAVHYLAELKRPLVFDDDASVAVWSKPLYRMRWVITTDPSRDDALLVQAFPWFTKHRMGISDVPTSTSDLVTQAMDYRLYVDKETSRNGKWLVVAGEWIGRSYQQHPDFALASEAGGAWGSSNDALQAAFPVLKELLEKGTPR